MRAPGQWLLRYENMPAEFRAPLMFVVAMTACAVAGCFADRYADEVGAEDERVMRAMVAISCKLASNES